MNEPLLLGIDVGTTSVKLAIFDLDGQLQAEIRTPYETHRYGGLHVEQKPDEWMRAILQGLVEMQARLPSSTIAAIGLTSQVNTHVFVDDNGAAVLPAIVWQDGRASEQARQLDARLSEAQRLSWWGAPMPIDASHALARAQWLKETEPALWSRTRQVLLPKDYCIQALTGVSVTDPLSNIGMVGLDGDWVDELHALVPGTRERLPPLADMASIAGRIRDDLPFAGTPVAVGTMDAWAGLFGCAVTAEGHGLYLSGTSEILGIVSETVTPTPGVLVMPRVHDMTLHVGPTQSGGASQSWLCELLQITPDEMSALAGKHERRAPAPLFLPHLQGERAPLWDASARGVFIGLDASTDRAAMAYAIYEGVAHSARWLLDSLQASAGTTLKVMNGGGGGFRSDVWNQLRADVLGVHLQRMAVTDPGTLGAAGLAAVATGHFDSTIAAFDTLVHVDRVFTPDASRADQLAERHALFRDTYAATRELSHRWLGGSPQLGDSYQSV